jgi:glutamate-1-semialdehyde 2,1-aminomutase
MEFFKAFHRLLLERGVYLGPSGYEVGFVSEAHTVNELHGVQRVMMDCLDEVFKKN